PSRPAFLRSGAKGSINAGLVWPEAAVEAAVVEAAEAAVEAVPVPVGLPELEGEVQLSFVAGNIRNHLKLYRRTKPVLQSLKIFFSWCTFLLFLFIQHHVLTYGALIAR
ncbi:MAG: hypothetical protein H6Q52_2742, partial [Deltaproteobacteria bacterium]|nr:hypothetical protein [Deltaproteobacteria bacterium]